MNKEINAQIFILTVLYTSFSVSYILYEIEILHSVQNDIIIVTLNGVKGLSRL